MRRTTIEPALVPQKAEARPRMSLNRNRFIEDAVIVPEGNREEAKNHPHFIEANTSGITLKELTELYRRGNPSSRRSIRRTHASGM